MRIPYRTIKRRTRAGKVYFQVRFLAEDGVTLKSKSYPEAKTRAQACRFAEADLMLGILPSNSNPPALDYIREFWSESSPTSNHAPLRGDLSPSPTVNLDFGISNTLKPSYKGNSSLILRRKDWKSTPTA